jgi:hypothetical protein
MGESRGVNRFLVRNPEGKRPLGKPRRRWDENIKMDLQEVRCGGLDLCGSGTGQVVGNCESGNVLPGSIKCGEFLD